MDNKPVPPDDQISISSLKQMFFGFFSLLFDFLNFLLVLVKKFIVLFIAFILLGALLGFLLFRSQKDMYEQTMIVKFNVLSKRTYFEMFDQLNNLATPKGYPALARELGLPEADVRTIHGISLENVNGTTLEKDTSSRMDQPLLIRVTTDNQGSLATLQNAILNKINNNDYLHQLKEQRRQISLSKIEWINGELGKLDSLKNEYTRSLNASRITATFYNNAFNPAEIFVQSNNLVNQKDELLRWLNEDYHSVTLIDGFKATGIPKTISLTRAILVGLILGVCISFIIAFLFHIRTLMR